MPTSDSIYELRRRAAIARRISNEVRSPADAQALLQMANDLEAEANRLEAEEATETLRVGTKR